MTEADKIIEYVLSQVGTAEDPLGSNKQKYGAYLDTIPWYLYKDGDKEWIHKVNGHDWCTQLHDASHVTVEGIDKARERLYRPVYNNMGAVVKYTYSYYKSNGAVGDTPRKGCSIFFQNSKGLSHIGIVVDFDDTTVTTVEGNTGKNGWYVAKKIYKRNDSYIYGYGYPDYKNVTPSELDGYKVGNTYEVKYDDLQIRTGPGTHYSVVGKLSKGDTIVCAALDSDVSGNTWMEHKTGWSCAHEGSKRYIDDVTKLTGWIKHDDKWYYYDENGNMLKSKWQLYKGQWYYLGEDGVMLTGWQKINGYSYFFYRNGHMASGEYIDGLFLDASGRQNYDTKAVWKQNNHGRWYEDQFGSYIRSRSMLIDGVEYEFDSVGYVIEK